MKISKNALKILNAANKSQPDMQGNLYSCYNLAHKYSICEETEAFDCTQALEKAELIIIPYDTSPHLFRLTDYGRHYAEIRFYETIDFFKTSILCPVVVTILTEAIIHGLPALLGLLLSQG